MYAQVTMVGRVTQDLEMRTKANGTPYTQVNLAVNEGYGEHTHTSFYQCWLQGDEATRAGKAGVKKGSLLFLSGQLTIADVTRKDNTKTRIAKVNYAHWDFVPSGKRSDDGANAAPNTGSPAAPAAAAPAAANPAAPAAQVPNDTDVLDLDEGDLPF